MADVAEQQWVPVFTYINMCFPMIYRVWYLSIGSLLKIVKKTFSLWKQGGHPVAGKEELK